MKKYFLLLPVAAFMLVGCGENKNADSNGYTEISMEDETAVNTFVDKVCDNLKSSYDNVGSGINIAFTEKISDLEVKIANQADIKGEDIEFTVNLFAKDLDKSFSEWQAAFDFSFKGKIILNASYEAAKMSIEFENLAFSLYLDKGVVYADFSNEELKDIVEYAVSMVTQDPSEVLEVIDSCLAKIKFIDLNDLGLDFNLDDFALPALTNESIAELKELINYALAYAKDEGPYSLKFLSNEDGSIAIKLDVNFVANESEVSGGIPLNEKFIGNIAVTFDASGKLTSITNNVNFEYSETYSSSVTESIKVVMEGSLNISYNASYSFPDFTEYEDSPLFGYIFGIVSNLSVIVG